MPFDPDAFNGRFPAYKAGARGMAETSPVNLDTSGGIHVQIDQTGCRMVAFKGDAMHFQRSRIKIKRHDSVGPEHV